ncbi:NUDIX hydrolase domain-like protein [Armillaria fumosa]|nr:NUDIX hydrolase domain-like protein [Armillaria fumosa]
MVIRNLRQSVPRSWLRCESLRTLWISRRCSSSGTMSSSQPVVPRPSASLVIINKRNEVLLVHRNPKASTFAGVHVFPGGNYDPKQDTSLPMTAIRETFEESGLLVGVTGSSLPAGPVLEAARHKIHSQKLLFQTFLDENQLSVRTDSDVLLPFTEWITPVDAPRRFHARFYVAFLDSGASSSSGFSSGHKQEQIPKPDGGQEVISARFIHPDDALAEFNEGKIIFMPPQFYILYTLAGILRGNRNLPEQRDRLAQLSRGMFGKMIMNPRRLEGSFVPGGTEGILTYEGDETRGGSKGRLHRALCRFMKGGLTTQIVLQRNFDIFTEIESNAFERSSKL